MQDFQLLGRELIDGAERRRCSIFERDVVTTLPISPHFTAQHTTTHMGAAHSRTTQLPLPGAAYSRTTLSYTRGTAYSRATLHGDRIQPSHILKGATG